MKNAIFLVLLGAGSLLSAVQVNADNGIKYNYGELRFIVDSDLDAYDVDGDGIGLGGSFRLDEVFYLTADYETLGYDDGIDVDTLQIAGGMIYPIKQVDAIAEIAVVNMDVDAPNGDSNTGFRLSAGARAYVMDKLEVRGTVNYIDVDEDDSYMTIAADYFVLPNVSVNVSKDIAADVDRFSIGVRYYIGE